MYAFIDDRRSIFTPCMNGGKVGGVKEIQEAIWEA
jgi:hypothetical protein